MNSSLSECSSITCSATFEWVSAQNGAVTRTAKVKSMNFLIVRNEFRDIYLIAASKTLNQKLLTTGIVIHKKFANEGKATIKFPKSNLNVLLSNAPPSDLLVFLKTLFVKMTSSKSSPKTMLKDKLLSVKQTSVQEISPINGKDVKRFKDDLPPNVKRKNPGEDSDKENGKKLRLMKTLNTLTEEQIAVLEAVKSGINVFFTGSAGTGKSFLLRHVINSLPPDSTVATASTGSAACLIGGVTLHSFAGIGSGDGTLERCIQLANRPGVLQNWRRCKHLIIDEISMIDSAFFMKIETIARTVRKNDKPFGGIQLIICGDFLQLPPVSKAKDKFCFMSSTWDSLNLRTFYLVQVHRQTDSTFISYLNEIRLGIVSNECTEALKDTETQNIEKDGILATKLCCFTKEANSINDLKLQKLPGNGKVFSCVDSSDSASKLLDDCTPVPKQIHLKEGAQVMLLKNINVGLGLVNGARGIIMKFVNGDPVVKFLSGNSYTVKYEKWTVKSSTGAIHSRSQIPLRLAWAFSIHKSQGLTLDCVELCLDNAFEAGQAYVALSRAKSLSSLRVLGFKANQVWASPEVLSYYKKLQREQRFTKDVLKYIPLGGSKIRKTVSNSLF